MSASLGELLLPQVVVDLISTLKRGRGAIGSWLGFHPTTYNERTVSLSGPNTTVNPGGTVRNLTYRIFNETRVPLKARAPGAPASTRAANPMAQNTIAIARFFESILLNYEMLGNMAAMLGPNSQIDEGGQSYIAQQEAYLVTQGHNMVEMLAAGMMRDSLYFISSGTIPNGGDDWLPSFTAPSGTQIGFQVPFQIPAGNKNQLNMLGAGDIIGTTWANAAAPIIGDLLQIQAAYAQLSRYSMTDIWINSTMWINVISNTEVRNVAGSANTPFASFDMESAPNNSGPPTFQARIRGVPYLTWHFDDDSAALGADTDPIYTQGTATLSKYVPDNMAIFTTAPSGDWCKLYYGGEYVVEQAGMPAMPRMGWYMWPMYLANPSCIQLFALLNAQAALYVPSVVAPGVVVF